MVTSALRPKVEIWPFRACTMINIIKICNITVIIVTVLSLWQWGRYHVPQNVFLVLTHIVAMLFQDIADAEMTKVDLHGMQVVWP